MEEQKQAVDAATWLSQYWEATIGFLMAVVIAPYVKWNHQRGDRASERITALENRVVSSEEVRDIVGETLEPTERAVTSLIDRIGKMSDTMTQIAMQIGPDAPRNRRGEDGE